MIARGTVAVALLALAACGGTRLDAEEPGAEAEPAIATVQLPGSRVSLALPASLVRVPHALRWRGEGLELRVADATLAPGDERALAEATLTQLAREHGVAPEQRPAAWDGAEGVDATLRSERARVRALVMWHDGAIARVLIVDTSDGASAPLAERILDSVRFDASARIDPVEALGLHVRIPPGLGLLRVTNEQFVFRQTGPEGEAAQASPFPCAMPAVEIAVVPFPEGRRPASDVERGRLLGARFAPLELGSPRVVVLDGALPGFAIATDATVEGTELSLYGAYLEGPDAVALVRASVESARAQRWLPLFADLTLTIELAQ